MKYNFKKIIAGISAAVFIFSSSIFTYAENFNDVPSNHYAYAAISAIASKGIMVGDTDGNFNPDKYIDKFDTSKMFAALLGFKYTNITDAEKTYFDKAYTDYKELIEKYSSKFSKWNSSTDMEVAFLLEKGFYTEDDLEQFVILSSEGAEQLRALSREEMASFLVRYIGKTAEAAAYNPTEKFKDDSSIAASKKNAVYYLKSIGIISGGTDGKFTPKGAVTRADFCYLLNLTMNKTGMGILNAIEDTSQTTSSDITNSGTVSCTIEKYFPSLSILQVNENNQHRLYKVLTSATIKVNDALGVISDVPIGADASITLLNGEITAIDTYSDSVIPSDIPVSNETTAESIVSETNTVYENETPTPSEESLTVISGTVDLISSDSITLSYNMLNARGSVVTQNKVYTISDDCVITKDGATVSSSSVEKGDMAEASIYGSEIRKLNLTSLDSENDNDASMLEGYIISINIGKDISTLGISETNDSDCTVYTIDENTVPIYALTIGDKVRAYISAGKITSLGIKKSYQLNSFTGYITSKKSDYIVVEYYDGEDVKTQKAYYDSDETKIISGISGKTIKFSELEEDMRVFVVLEDDGNIAENISLIENI